MLTGFVNRATPWCVIQEMCIPHFKDIPKDIPQNIDLEVIIYHINNAKPFQLSSENSENFNEKDWSIIAQFLNRSEKLWDTETLNLAFHFILPLLKEDYSTFLTQLNFDSDGNSIGIFTSIATESLTPCILYNLSQYFGIPTCLGTSLETMYLSVKNKIQTKPDLRNLLKTIVRQASKEQLIAMLASVNDHRILGKNFLELNLPIYSHINKWNEYNDVCYENLVKSYRRLVSSSILSSSSPSSLVSSSILSSAPSSPSSQHTSPILKGKCDAVVYAAKKYYVDLSQANDPLQKLLENKDISNFPSTKTCFNPLLPPELYDSTYMWEQCLHEGFTIEDIRSTSHAARHEMLKNLYYKENNFHITPPSAPPIFTIICRDEVWELDPDEVLYFGPYFGTPCFATTYLELADWFLSQRNFICPHNVNMVFTEMHLRKLKNICASEDEKQKNTDKKRRLLFVMTQIHLEHENVHNSLKKLSQLFINISNSKKKLLLKRCIVKLFYFALTLRGWLGEQNFLSKEKKIMLEEEMWPMDEICKYPIKKAPVDNQIEVDQKVSETLNELQKYISEVKEVLDFNILEIPLLLYRDGQFICSNSKENGYTIGDRISILLSKDQEVNEESCMRRGSNWFLSTSYHLMEILEISPPFRIEDMSEIS